MITPTVKHWNCFKDEMSCGMDTQLREGRYLTGIKTVKCRPFTIENNQVL